MSNFGELRARLLIALVQGDVPTERLWGPTDEEKAKKLSRSFRLAVTADTLARTCVEIWTESDKREAERN